MTDKSNNKLNNKEFLEKELQRLNEIANFIKKQLREIDNVNSSWIWERFLFFCLLGEKLWRVSSFRFFLGSIIVILLILIANYYNLLDFPRSVSPRTGAAPHIELWSKVKNFIISLGDLIYKAFAVVFFVTVGAVGNFSYDHFRKSEDASFDQEDGGIGIPRAGTAAASEDETTAAPEAETTAALGTQTTALEASASISSKKDVATQTIEAYSNRDSLLQLQQLIDFSAERSMRSSSVLQVTIEELMANDSENAKLKGLEESQDPGLKDVNYIEYRAAAERAAVELFDSENRNEDAASSSTSQRKILASDRKKD